VFCIVLIAIVLLRCICSSFNDSKDYIENNIEAGTPSIVYINSLKDDEDIFVGNDDIAGGTIPGTGKQLGSNILRQQMEIYQMANYNKIKPSYI
jgi:hypothetical protein